MSELGQKVFEGHGQTNKMFLEKANDTPVIELILASQRRTDKSMRLDRYLDAVPTEIASESSSSPFNLQVITIPSLGNVERLNDGCHFIDVPPEQNRVYTYTVYAFDRTGNLSYPVFVYGEAPASGVNRSVKDTEK